MEQLVSELEGWMLKEITRLGQSPEGLRIFSLSGKRCTHGMGELRAIARAEPCCVIVQLRNFRSSNF
jgi:hypothetical protein